jgi:hypothetical protein
MYNAMDQEVSYQPETAETWVRSQASPCEICGGKCETDRFLSEYCVFTPVSIIPPMVHTHPHPICSSYKKV